MISFVIPFIDNLLYGFFLLNTRTKIRNKDLLFSKFVLLYVHIFRIYFFHLSLALIENSDLMESRVFFAFLRLTKSTV